MFRYTISEEDYLNMSKWMFVERRGNKKAAILKLLLKTVGQMGVAAFLILFYKDQVEAWMKWMVGILSGLWALLSLFQYFFLDLRAKMLLAQSKNNPQAADFWKEHRLDTADDKVRLSFGGTKMELPFTEVSRIDETDTLWLIRRGRDVFELVPKKAVPEERWTAFTEEILGGREQAKREKLAGFRQSLLEEAPFAKKLSLSRRELAEKTVKMKRLSLRYTCGWSPFMAFTFLFPLGAGVYSLIGGSWAAFALCIGTFILFNFRLFAVFTPRYTDLVESRLEEPAEDGYLLAVRDKTAYMLAASSGVSYALDKLKKKVTESDGLYLFFEKQTMLFVPREVSDAFQVAAGYRKSIRDRAAALPAPAAAEAEDLPEEAGEEEEPERPSEEG